MDAKYNLKMKTQGMDKAQREVKGLKGSLAGLAKGAMATAGAFLGARALYGGLKTTLDLFGQEEMAVKKLTASLGKNSPALEAQARALQRVSLYGNEAIMEAQALIGAFVKDEEAIKKATIATLDLASAKGMDLVGSADLVSKTLGSSTNALSRYGIEVVGAVGSTERLDSLTGNLAKVFGGQATAMTDTFSGSMTQLGNLIGDVGEEIGGYFAPAIRSMAESFSEMIDTPLSEELENDRQTMEGLFSVLDDTNTSLELRRDTIDEINSKYGAYLPNMITEKTSLEEIKKAHVKIRGEIIKNIAVEINKEKITENLKKHLELRRKEKALVLDVVSAKANETDAYARHKEAVTKVNETTIAGIDTNDRYADTQMDNMEKAMFLGEAVDYSTMAIENATNQTNLYTEALANNRAEQMLLKEEIEVMQEDATELGETYVANEETEIDAIKNSIKWKDLVSKKDARMVALQAQDAKSGAVNVIKAEMAEATAGLIASMLKNVAYPWNLILAGTAGGLVNGLMGGMFEKLAEGSDRVVTKPTMFMAGEQGAERVSVTNLTKSGGGINSPDQGSPIIINAEVASEEFFDRLIDYMENKRDLNLA